MELKEREVIFKKAIITLVKGETLDYSGGVKLMQC